MNYLYFCMNKKIIFSVIIMKNNAEIFLFYIKMFVNL